MSEEIDVSKPPPSDACPFCSRTKIYGKPNKDEIEPSQFFLDMIHSDVLNLYLLSYLGCKYYISFLNGYDKTSEIILYSSKYGVLSAFNLFRKRNQFRETRI